MNRAVTIYGASGHTGRFVVAEVRRRGWTPILSGRDAAKLNLLAEAISGAIVRPASIDDPHALDLALEGATAVINCAGPFATTAGPVIEASLRAGIPYLDVAAEIEANLDTFAHYQSRAIEHGTTIAPAMAFFGGLGDLLASAAMGDWVAADEIAIAYGLSGWVPTKGTLIAGQVSRQRRGGRRIVHSKDGLGLTSEEPPVSEWTFPAPFGKQPVVEEFTMADTVTIARHLRVANIRSCMTTSAIADLRGADPSAANRGSGQPPEQFMVDVVARANGAERRITAAGQDIYATSAPLVVEAAARLLDSDSRQPGVFAAGELFDARDFLNALSPEHLTIRFH